MADSSHLNILEAMKTALEALSLSGIADADIVIVENYLDAVTAFVTNPQAYFSTDATGILIAPAGRERLGQDFPNSNIRDSVGYPCALIMCDETTTGQQVSATTTALDKRLLWRQSIRERFNNQQLTVSGGNACNCVTEFGDISAARYLKENLWVGALIIYAIKRETRAS